MSFIRSTSSFFYKTVAKPFFFRQDPEKVHDQMTSLGVWLGAHSGTQQLTSWLFSFQNSVLSQTLHGVTFPNPVGLAAGFDKNAQMMNVLEAVGLGAVEVGSVTGEPCAGNAKPRLWRLPKSKSLVVYYGLKNEGCETIVKHFEKKSWRIPVGVSIAKTNSPDTCEVARGIADYAKAFRVMEPVADYLTVNISCPNAFGGEPFTDPTRLDSLLTELDKISTDKPVFLKLAADLSFMEVDALVAVARRHRVHGLISTNLTKSRTNPKLQDATIPEKGGLSGKVVEDLANAQLEHLARTVGKDFILIGCGGIFSAEDAYKKIRLGASLVQLITGMIYEGPQLIGEINQGLARLLKRDGFANISEAIGTDIRSKT